MSDTKTSRERVMDRWPGATVGRIDYVGSINAEYVVYSAEGKELGDGPTKDAAWEDAASNI